jgi:hypothetical protein
MTDAILMLVVLGVIVIASGIDIAAAIAWLTRRLHRD